jgi:hypothetical protein
MKRNPDYIGRKWMSTSGERTVIGVHPSGRLIVQDPVHVLPFLVRPEELEREIAIDERQHAAYAHQAPPKVEAPKPAAPEADYAATFPPMRRAKVLAALATFIVVSGVGGPRGEHLRRLAANGYRREGDRVIGPNGTFYDLRAFGKTGGDYLDFLTKKANNPPRRKRRRRNPDYIGRKRRPASGRSPRRNPRSPIRSYNIAVEERLGKADPLPMWVNVVSGLSKQTLDDIGDALEKRVSAKIDSWTLEKVVVSNRKVVWDDLVGNIAKYTMMVEIKVWD